MSYERVAVDAPPHAVVAALREAIAACDMSPDLRELTTDVRECA